MWMAARRGSLGEKRNDAEAAIMSDAPSIALIKGHKGQDSFSIVFSPSRLRTTKLRRGSA
jgi:hypothetical protein